MGLDHFLHFIIAHNERIILLTIGAISLLSVFVVYWQIFGKKDVEEKAAATQLDISEIEKSLQKILSQTNTAIQSVSTEAAGVKAGTPAPSGASTAELELLKQELEMKASIVEDLQKQVETAKKDSGASPELLAKIKTLEGRLAEYEIIEDDIADLSIYKEENANLKRELDMLKRGGAGLVDQFAEAVAKTGGDAPAPATPAASAAPSDIDPLEAALAAEMAASAPTAAAKTPEDFVAAVMDVQKEASAPTTVAVSAAPPAASEPVPPAEKSVSAGVPITEAKNDIFGEFSDGGEGAAGADPFADLGEIDTNRMLDELKDLNVDMEIGAEALDEAPDIEKMAEEAQNLDGKKH